MNARQELARVSLELGHMQADIAEMKQALGNHEKQHVKDREDAERRTTATRRFRIAAGAAWITSITGLVALLVEVSSKLH